MSPLQSGSWKNQEKPHDKQDKRHGLRLPDTPYESWGRTEDPLREAVFEFFQPQESV